MKVKELVHRIEGLYPVQTAMGFDNVGLLCGHHEQEIQAIYIALDVSDSSIKAAIKSGANLLLTHHPLLLSPISSVTSNSTIGRYLFQLIENRIACYTVHTNYDVSRMAVLVGELLDLEVMEVLEETHADGLLGIGRIGVIQEECALETLAAQVKDKLTLNQLRIYGDLGQSIDRIAVCPGSGKSVIEAAILKKADVLITGDIGHHDALYALDNGLSIIDAGHYGTEFPFVKDMKHWMNREFPQISTFTEPMHHPYSTL